MPHSAVEVRIEEGTIVNFEHGQVNARVNGFDRCGH